ncbi:MAG: DUF393 domain-containing protein [Pirellulales bacterium]
MASAVTTSSPVLPTMAERPGAAVVIYDGDCRFCQGQVARLNRFDWGRHLAFVSLHDPVVAQRWPDLTYEQLMEQMWVIAPDGRRYGGASALRYLSRHLVPLWPICPLLHIPGTLGLWRTLYKQVAIRRYQLAGKNSCDSDACSIHFGTTRNTPQRS